MRIIFFSGSSSVGKSEALAQLPESYIRAPLSARDARERLGNPDWTTLMTDTQIAQSHQDAILAWFKREINRQIEECAEHTKGDCTIVFERCLWDIAGYSYAFGCSYPYVSRQVMKIKEFEYQLIEWIAETFGKFHEEVPFHTVYFALDETIPYKGITARPPEHIRFRQNAWLKLFLYDQSIFTRPLMIKTSKDTITDILCALDKHPST